MAVYGKECRKVVGTEETCLLVWDSSLLWFSVCIHNSGVGTTTTAGKEARK